jgi:hypothetical protein
MGGEPSPPMYHYIAATIKQISLREKYRNAHFYLLIGVSDGVQSNILSWPSSRREDVNNLENEGGKPVSGRPKQGEKRLVVILPDLFLWPQCPQRWWVSLLSHRWQFEG